MARSDVLISEPMLFPLPTLEGFVHGIVGVNPCRVQCDDCLRVWTAQKAFWAVREVMFNPKCGEKYLRLCDPCWEARGWFEGYFGKEYLGGEA